MGIASNARSRENAPGAGRARGEVRMAIDPSLGDEDYCYLTTTGRRTGRPHEIEIWFALDGDTLYMLSGGRARSDWVRNARADPEVRLRIAGSTFTGRARLLRRGAEDARARKAVAGKYRARGNRGLGEWEREALVVAVDLTSEEAGA
jgi:deazaflavin-dependent oxidoreductase (nitroreductase family)